MARLYELQDQLVRIDEILENNTNPETQEILESAKDELLQEINGKVENILNFIADCKGKAEQFKVEEERINKKRKSLENKIDYLKNLIFGYMKAHDQQKAEYGTWNCSISKTTPKVIIDDEMWLPSDFIKTTTTVDKVAVKNAMTDGVFKVVMDNREIQVAHLEQGESLRIK